MILHHVPGLVQRIFPQYTWHKDRERKDIYLTFDDGPVPGVTEKVLKILDDYNCKATFFMVGHNVAKYSSLAKEVLAAGHLIGNHTYHHINGYTCTTDTYLADLLKCQETIQEILEVKSVCFRPPYGRITSEQGRKIGVTHEVIMWDVLSGDYEKKLSAEKVLEKTIKHTQNGSIIVFHDQEKTTDRLPIILSDFLKYSSHKGFLPVTL